MDEFQIYECAHGTDEADCPECGPRNTRRFAAVVICYGLLLALFVTWIVWAWWA